MERQDGKTTIWVPKEAFESVQRFWKPEFNWVPVPVDRSLPPGQIAYIKTDNGPVSPLPPPPKTPKTPLVPKTPRTPLDLPPLETASLPQRTGLNREQQTGYFDDSPDLETAITRGFSPANTDGPGTPSTATEPDSPDTPKDLPSLPRNLPSPQLSLPKPSPPALPRPSFTRPSAKPKTKPKPALQRPSLWEHSRPSYEELHSEIYQRWAQGFPGFPGFNRDEQEAEQAGRKQTPWKVVEDNVKWRMVDQRHRYHPKDNLRPASWNTLHGGHDLKMNDKWSTFRRDEAHWNGSKKGFAVRMDMHLNVEVQLKGRVNGDITLSAEALYVSTLSLVCKHNGSRGILTWV